ncbi:cation diffusion facilitator family transporter [Sulfitobacter sp. LCG007]
MTEVEHKHQPAGQPPDGPHDHRSDHSHSHSGGHSDHHSLGAGHIHVGSERTIGLAALLTGGFMLVELVGGLVSGSLALLADAGHMLTDFGALVLAWGAFRLARRPADWRRTYGFDRFSVLAAFVNGLALFGIAFWICAEAIHRLRDPGEVVGGIMFWVALAGLAVNLLCFWVLTRGEGENLNIRAAALHVAGDILGSLGALVAALVITTTGWTPIDPILSVLVALIILRSAWHVVRESGHILLEGSPRGFDSRAVAETLCAEVPGLVAVSHVHAWSITQEQPMATLEAEISEGSDDDRIRGHIKQVLRERFGVDHVTVETSRALPSRQNV